MMPANGEPHILNGAKDVNEELSYEDQRELKVDGEVSSE